MQKIGTATEESKQIKELNSAMSILLDSKDKESPESISSLQNVFDLLLWAEKKNVGVLQSILQSQLLSFLIQKYAQKIQRVFTGMIMLLGNAKESGPIGSHILERRLGDRVLRLYLQLLSQEEHIQQEQQLHLIGSFLKAYYRHFTKDNYPFFIQVDRCLLIEISCKFFNCPEEITRTSVMNILMSLLKLPFINEILAIKQIGMKVASWCKDMCRLLRNELKDFDQHLLITDQAESQFIIHSINDKIILWEDLSALMPHLFAPHFHSQIVLPLVVGSLNTTGIPLFTLKFALFVVNKLIPIIGKLGLLPDLGSLIFEQKDVEYYDRQLGTAYLKPFAIKKLLKEDPLAEQQQDQPNIFKNLNQFFMNIFRSKDGRFLECACILLGNLLSAVKKCPQACKIFVQRLGFGLGGSTVLQLSNIIITHFTAIHTLEIMRIISALLVYMQPSKYLDDQIKNRFFHVYGQLVDEAMLTIEKNKQAHAYLAEVLEYDIKTLFSSMFSFQPVIKSDSALLFNNQIIENDSLPFYHQIPETTGNVARYQIMKALLLRKLNHKLIEQNQKEIPLEAHYEKLRGKEAAHIKPGQYLQLPIHVSSYRCKLQDGKIVIPDCLLLQDELSLIIGYLDNKSIRIITNFKYKHIRTQVHHKKDKLYVNVNIRRYNPQTQNLQQSKGFLLKHIQIGQNYFSVKKHKAISHQINILLDLLKKSKKLIPELSLI